MRDRTMIAWNEYQLGLEKPYQTLGYHIFGNRISLTSDTLDMMRFLQQIDAQSKE